MKPTVIIPAWNKLSLTQACVASLLETTSRDEVDILVVDNGSEDGTAAWLDDQEASGHLRCIRNAQNLGFAKASNQGVQATSGDVIFMNNDIVARPGWLEPLRDALTAADVGAAGSLLLYPGSDLIQHAGVGVGLYKKRMKVWHRFPHRPLSHNPEAQIDCDCMAITAACMMVKRSAIDAVGMFDETFLNGYEDVDLCLRIHQSGLKLRYCASSVLEHHESVTEGRHASEMRNRKILFERWERKIECTLGGQNVRATLEENDIRRRLVLGTVQPKELAKLSKILASSGRMEEAALWKELSGQRWLLPRVIPSEDRQRFLMASLGYGTTLPFPRQRPSLSAA